MLDLVHRTYEADESFRSLDFMVHTRLLVLADHPADRAGHAGAAGAAGGQPVVEVLRRPARRAMYSVACCLTMVGIFAMRWNVVIGGQLFSKSFLGYTSYKVDLVTREGLVPAIGLMLLPFVDLFRADQTPAAMAGKKTT